MKQKRTSRNKNEAFQLDGELTIYTCADKKQELTVVMSESGKADIDLDLSQVTEIDTAGLQLLILMKTRMTQEERQMNVTAYNDVIQDVMDLCNLSGLFSIPQVIPHQESVRGK